MPKFSWETSRAGRAEVTRGLYADRRNAGRVLARRLSEYADRRGVVVLGLPRGGVPIAYEIAARLRVPLDVLVVRKLGAPGQEELAVGAIASGGVLVLNDEIVASIGLEPEEIEAIVERETIELERRERLYRGARPPLDVNGRTIIVADDGLATGATMSAAIQALRTQAVSAIIVAVPIGAPETCAEIAKQADAILCAHVPRRLLAIGNWYDDFSATSDDEVRTLLAAAQRVSEPS